jgi:Fe-S-cluster containining protein
VLLLPGEVSLIERHARENNLTVRILPRIAVGRVSPERIVAYQMMGKNEDGDLCPFLRVESSERAPHGGFRCGIYDDRPLACRAYPLLEGDEPPKLDEHCRFCRDFSTSTASAQTLRSELAALEQIKSEVTVSDDSLRIWRYATGTGRPEDNEMMLPEGWIIEE